MDSDRLWRVRRVSGDQDQSELQVSISSQIMQNPNYISQPIPDYREISEVGDLNSLSFYHPNVNRHVAESLLLQNGTDGTYLLRPSSKEGETALSVRCRDSVKHFPLKWDGEQLHFGLSTFPSVNDLLLHFNARPLIGSESGTLTALKFPYPRDVDEPVYYDTVKVHASFPHRGLEDSNGPDFTVASKEGFLTKQGKIVKSWRLRWFTLQRYELRYHRDKDDKVPIRILNLLECTDCSRNHSTDKEHCFSLTFPYRTFYMYAATHEEMAEWMSLIRWKLRHKTPTPTPEVPATPDNTSQVSGRSTPNGLCENSLKTGRSTFHMSDM